MTHPARAAAAASMSAVSRGAKDEWLALFAEDAEDAVVEDPVGPSSFDPAGDGHRGHAAISAFWDKLARLSGILLRSSRSSGWRGFPGELWLGAVTVP